MKKLHHFGAYKRTRLILTALCAACLTMTAWTGSGTNPGPSERAERDREPRHLARELEMDNDQMEAMRSRMRANRENFTALYRQRDLAKAELDDFFADPASDENAIQAAGRRLAEINAEITRQQVESRLALRRTLTREQYQRLQKLRGKMQERRLDQRPEQRPVQRPDRSQRGRRKDQPE